MAVPNKKMYDRKGKLIFDPSNPEDVRRQEELNKQIEMAKQLFSIVDPRGGGGIGAMARGISKAALAKMSKSKFTQNKAKQILELVTKPMTRGKKAASNTRKQAAPTVKEVVETKPTIPTTVPAASDKIKSLSNAEIKAFENVKNVRELAEKQAKNSPIKKTTAPKKSVSDIIRETIANRKLGTKGPTREEMKAYIQKNQKAKNTAKDIVTNKKLKTELEKIREANKPFYEKSIKESVDAINKKIAIGTGIIGGLTAAGGTYYGMQLSNKDKKQTTTPQKTSPVDLKRITNTKPSSIPGVSIVKGTDGKDYGIVWNNTTKSWDYYRGDKTKKTPENKQKQEKVRGGGYIPIDNTDKNKGNNQGGGTNTGGGGTGGGTKPRSATGQAFDKAFAEARKQAGGAGGIFEWNGKKYGTALVGETVPKDRVEVGKTTTPVTIKNDYPTAESDPTLEIAMQQDSIRQQMATKPLPTKPLSELVFKTTAKAAESQKIRNSMDEQNALRSIIADNRIPLKKKRYGGNLAMLKYMK